MLQWVEVIKIKKIVQILIYIILFKISVYGNYRVKQGEFLIINIPKEGSIKDYKIKTNLNFDKVKIYENNDNRFSLVPAHYNLALGHYHIEIKSEKYHEMINIEVIDGKFKQSKIYVTNKMKKKNSKKNKSKMIKTSGDAKKDSSSVAYFDGKFIIPTLGEKTTGFGFTRYVNDKFNGRHSGIDYALKIGTKVNSTNNGKVTFAGYLTSTGNTLIIDHGYNIFSSYSHLKEIKVKKGDIVKKGQIIALSGNTGFTTGPHLHFTISIGKTFVNPNLFFINDYDL